jgi:hypothetical protein
MIRAPREGNGVRTGTAGELKETSAAVEPRSMSSPQRSARECAAFLVLGALIVAILATTFTATAAIGGALGLAVGLTAGAGTAQVLRRPAGRVIGRLVDA